MDEKVERDDMRSRIADASGGRRIDRSDLYPCSRNKYHQIRVHGFSE
jgi:hypothetical protein